MEEPVKLTDLENTQEGTMRATRSLHTESGIETLDLQTWIRRDKSGLVRENTVEIEFISLKFEYRLLRNTFSLHSPQ